MFDLSEITEKFKFLNKIALLITLIYIEYTNCLINRPNMYYDMLSLLMDVIIMESGCPTRSSSTVVFISVQAVSYSPDKSLSHTAPYCALFVPLIFLLFGPVCPRKLI